MNKKGFSSEVYSQISWQGYARQNGKKGIRNKVLIIYTVECASFVAKQIAQIIGHKDIDVVGFTGCCDNEYAVRMLIALIRHPNVGAVLAVGLGCEYVQPHTLAEIARKEGKVTESFYIQDVGGTKNAVEKGVNAVSEMLRRLKDTPKCSMSIKDLVVGCECGGSDYTSGLAGNATAGKFFDYLVDLQGIAIFEEIVEAIGLQDYLMSRAATDEIRKLIGWTYDKALDHCKSIHQFAISPGNFMGGLSSIEEKSMGSVVKSGSRPIVGVTKVSIPPTHKGLWLLDSTPDPYFMGFGKTNPNDSEGLMDLISCGCHIVFLVTGRGSVVGSAVAPVLKITGNTKTYETMRDDMDFNAGACISGEKDLDEMALQLLEDVISVCQGRETKAEILGHKEYYIPYKYQDVESLQKRCSFQ
ncbi:MAG: UxaA family hydrolase [Clostridia bacterium]